jgi:hypothetical protein
VSAHCTLLITKMNPCSRALKHWKLFEQELLEIWGNESGWRESEKKRDRDDRWQAFVDFDNNVRERPGFRNNKTGNPSYDIFTLKPIAGYAGDKMLYKEELAR